MSCNGCRVLRKGCSENCVLRQCLKCIDSPEAQANATLFVTKFFGRAGLTGFINGVPESQRPALFQSLLYEACGRTVNPVHGAVGLLYSGNWHLCQAAVETVLRGGSLKPANINGNPNTQSKLFPSSCRRADASSAAPAQESSSFTSDGSLKALQSNIQPFIDFSSGCSSEAVPVRPAPLKRTRETTNKKEMHDTAVEDAMAKQPRSWYSSEVHAKQQQPVSAIASTVAGHGENDVIANPSSRFDASENALQAQNPSKLGGFNQSCTLVAPVARRARPSGLPSHQSIAIAAGRQDHESSLMFGCSTATVLDHDRSTISSDSELDHDHGHGHSVELDLSLKSHPVLCQSPQKHDAAVLRVSSPSVNSESSVTGLHDMDPQSEKQEIKLLHLLV